MLTQADLLTETCLPVLLCLQEKYVQGHQSPGPSAILFLTVNYKLAPNYFTSAS